MEFDRIDKERKFALLTPVFDQNASLKAEARDAGVTVEFSRADHGYRLFEDSIPKGLDVDAVFGKYVTPEAREAAAAERSAFEAKMQNADKTISPAIDESKLYYPTQKDKEREAFDKLREETGVDMKYSPKAGAFVLRAGDPAGFEKWQTPEMKAQWTAEGEARKSKQAERVSDAGKAVEKIGKIADGKTFLAEHENGFMLPSKDRHPELHTGLVDSLSATKRGGKVKDVSDEDLTQVLKNTQSSLKVLERKKYAVELQGAQAKDPSLTVEKFNGMNDKDRRAASGFKGMSNEDFSRMVALRSGFFALRTEMIDRGLMLTTEQARDLQADNAASKDASARSNEMGRSSKPEAEKTAAKAAEPAKQEPAKQAAAKGAAKKNEADKEVKPATAGAMAQALQNAGYGR